MRNKIEFYKHKIINFLLKKPFLNLFFCIVLTTLSFFPVSKLKLDTSLISLLPDNYESVQNSKMLIKELGGLDQFVLLLHSNDLQTTLKYAEKLKTEFLKLKEFKTVYYTKNMEFFYDHSLLYTDLDRLKTIKKKIKKMISQEKLKKSTFYIDIREESSSSKSDNITNELDEFINELKLTDEKKYHLDPKTNTLGMVIIPFGSSADVAQTKNLYALLNDTISKNPPQAFDSSLNIQIGGSFKNKIDEYDAVIANAKDSATWVTLLILLILVFYFKNYLSPIALLIPLIFSIFWTFALTKIVIGGLNIFTLFLFLILLGFGIDIGIIIYSRYIDFRKKMNSISISLYNTYNSMTAAVFTSVFTTVLAFLLLVFTRFKGFSEFGFITAVGIVFAMCSYFLCFPAFMIMLEKINFTKFRIEFHSRLFEKLLNRKVSIKLSKYTLVSICVLTLLLLPFSFFVQFDYDFKNLRPQVKQFEDIRTNIGKVFKESFSPAVLFTKSIEEVDEVINYFDQKISNKEITTVEKIRTIRDIVPKDQKEKIEIITSIRESLTKTIIPALKKKTDEASRLKLEKINLILPEFYKDKEITLNDVPEFFSSKFFNLSKTKYATFIYPSVQLRDGRNAMKFSDELTKMKINDKIYSAASGNIVLADVLRTVMKSGLLAFILAMLGTFIILLVDFRSFTRALLVDLPHLLGFIWIAALMFLTDVKLNFYNIISFSILMGMGINPAIYIYHRYLEDKKFDFKNSILPTVIATTVTTLTTIVGFLGISFTVHGGLRSLGLLTAIGMAVFHIITLFLMIPLIHIKAAKRSDNDLKPFSDGHLYTYNEKQLESKI